MDRLQKRDFVDFLVKVFGSADIVIVTRNDGLTVADATDLRRKVREIGATFKVAKNRLALRALHNTPFESIASHLKGPTALAWADEPVAVAKALVDFAKKNEKLVLLGGMLGGQMLDVAAIKALADLPSLDELRAKLVGMISTPATRLAGVTQAPAGHLARVFGAYGKSAKAA